MVKKNIQTSKQYLNQALTSLPPDFALRETKFHIFQAIKQIEKVENRRVKREEMNKAIVELQNPYTSKRTLDIINQMIDGEKKKLEEIESTTENATEIQTLFG